MRKHIDYYYKCFDRENNTELERIVNEKFNDYGYNFDTNRRRIKSEDCLNRINHNNCLKTKKEEK